MDQNNTYNNIPEGAPSAEQPIYHYTRPEQNVAPEPPAYQPPQYDAPQPPQKKPEKPLTKKALIPLIAGVAAVSLVLGLVGGALGARLWNKQEVIPEGTAVVYQTAKLKDADGKTAKETLAIPEVAELVKDSVVEITTEQIVTGSFMQQYVSEGAGSGVIITADGYLVTNHHVIEGATNINVRLADGKEYKAKLIGSDAKTDLAVIKIDAKELKPAAFGASSELLVGEEVVAVGNPLGKLGGTVTKGIISALDREITIDNTTMRLLQTDTAINPGNSGGGMFNTSGQLVGVINAKSAGEEIEGLGFAIPIDTAKAVIEDLIGHGYVTGRVDPGFVFVEINDTMTAMMYRVNELGLYISSVADGSDAQKAGFKSGDYVLKIEGEEVSTEAEANAAIDGKKVGETLTVIVKRNGKEKTITLTLSEYTPQEEKQTSVSPFGNPFLN
ncbi:MAG: trypsin-like peptidase domain-containing protein [Clostridia bacterium]|nr:trypsin-like peptidase domain-containing protein [Clostridia bacterium]